MKQKSISFSLCPENIKYVMDSFPVKHRNKSHWLDDLITHLRTKSKIVEKQKKPVKRFLPPKIGEVINYCNERQNNVDANHFVDFYSSKDWMVGKNKMKDWKACIRTWENQNNKNRKGVAELKSQLDNTEWAEGLEDVL